MSIEEIKALVSRWSEDIWQKADVTAMDHLYDPSFVFHYPGVQVKPDRNGFKKTVTAWISPFTETEFNPEEILVSGDKITVRWTWSGTHEGKYMGISGTGKRVTMTGISILQIADGKIVEEWGEMDNHGLGKQLLNSFWNEIKSNPDFFFNTFFTGE